VEKKKERFGLRENQFNLDMDSVGPTERDNDGSSGLCSSRCGVRSGGARDCDNETPLAAAAAT